MTETPAEADPALEAAIDRIYLLYEEEKLDEAKAQLMPLLEQPGLPSDAYALAATLLYELEEDPAQIETLMRQYLALVPDDAQSWSFLGEVLTENGRWEDATEAYNHALEIDPALADARLGMAEINLAQNDDVAGAEAVYRSVLEDEPDHPVALFSLATLLQTRLDRPEEAQAIYQQIDRMMEESDDPRLEAANDD